MRVLIDQDGVLADFEAGFIRAMQAYGLPLTFAADDRELWDLSHYVPAMPCNLVELLMQQPGFFRTLPVIPGAIEGVLGLLNAGHDIWICSTPVISSEHCENEKKAWLREHFGEYLTHHVVFTPDKTLVKGDLLIDDKPQITGVYEPVWEQVIYDQPYNRKVTGRRRMTWANWRAVIGGADMRGETSDGC